MNVNYLFSLKIENNHEYIYDRNKNFTNAFSNVWQFLSHLKWSISDYIFLASRYSICWAPVLWREILINEVCIFSWPFLVWCQKWFSSLISINHMFIGFSIIRLTFCQIIRYYKIEESVHICMFAVYPKYCIPFFDSQFSIELRILF